MIKKLNPDGAEVYSHYSKSFWQKYQGEILLGVLIVLFLISALYGK